MRRVARAVAAALFVSVLSTPAFADPTPQDISQARDLGQQAQAAHEAGNYGESERLWTAASRLYPAAPTLTLGLARAQAKQGKYVLARENYNKIIREQSNNASASQAFKDALAAAQAEIEAASAKIAHVTITVAGSEGAPNAQVTIDGEAVNAAGLGVPRPTDPGKHTVKATAEGYLPTETTFEVADGGKAEAKLTLTKDPSAAAVSTAPPATAPSTTAPPPTTVTKRDHTLALVAFGVGGAGLVFGGVTGAMALGKHSDLAKTCTDGKCPSTLQSDVDGFHTMATLSTIGFIVGGAGVAAGAVLWFAGPKKEVPVAASAKSIEWHPYFAGTGGGVTGRF